MKWLLYLFLFLLCFYVVWRIIRKVFKSLTKKSFTGKTVLVTGGSQGIGLCLVKEFLKERCNVVVWDIVDFDMEKVGKNHTAVDSYIVDVSDRELIEKTAQEVIEKHGGVDIIINNAGITLRTDILNVSPEGIEKTFGINFFGQVWVIRSFLPGMIERNEGHIMCMSSSGGIIAIPNSQVYSPTKFALFGLMESLRMQIKKEGISVDTTIVCPSYVNTTLTKEIKDQSIKKMSPEALAKEVVEGMKNREELIVLPRRNKYFIFFFRFMFDPWVLDIIAKKIGLWNVYDGARKGGVKKGGLREACKEKKN